MTDEQMNSSEPAPKGAQYRAIQRVVMAGWSGGSTPGAPTTHAKRKMLVPHIFFLNFFCVCDSIQEVSV